MSETTEQATVTGDTRTDPPGTRKEDHEPAVDRIWRFLSSTRLAIILILAIATLSLVGALVDQMPLGVDPTRYAELVQIARQRYGVWTDVLSALGLFSVAESIWMKVLLALLAVSTFVCTMNRWPRIWASVFSPTVRADDQMLGGMQARREAQLSHGDPGADLATALARRGYRVRTERAEQATYVYADRFRFARLGTLVAHLALVGVLAGTVVTATLGFRDDEFMIPVGYTRPVGFGTSLQVRADAFVDEYYVTGGPKDYRSDIVLLDRGTEVARHTVRVNEPLIYSGIRFHQASLGQAAVLEVRDASGGVIYQDAVPLPSLVGMFRVKGTPYVAQVIGTTGDPADGPPLPGQVRVDIYTTRSGRVALAGGDILTLGEPKDIAGLKYTFVREQQFTQLSVVSDPGAPIIWVMSALFVLGMGATFYFPFPRFWARYVGPADGPLQATIAATKGRAGDIGPELDEIVREAHRVPTPVSQRASVNASTEGSSPQRQAKRSSRR